MNQPSADDQRRIIDEPTTLPPAPPSEAATLPAARTTTFPPLPQTPGDGELSAKLPTIPGFEMLAELGRGGMGVVYQARQVTLNRVVALKMILSGGLAQPDQKARFLAEAEAVAALHHPGIVQIYELGTHDGLPYFSLEFCPDGSLAKKLAGTPLPPSEAAIMVERLARAMHSAHEHGIVHRDLKPGNVLLDAQGMPKVTDFGLAKRVDAEHLTQSGAIMGTPSYMAPEQAKASKQIGPAADIYALGAILYECLTGRAPFKAATPLDTVLQVISEEPVPVRRLTPRIPADLETICHKCLQKDAEKRYASALALADDLGRWQRGEPITARPVGRAERAWRWCRRNPALAGSLAAVMVVVALGVIGLTAGLIVVTGLNSRLDSARQTAETERDRVQKNLQTALKALDGIYLQVAEERLPRDPQRKKEDTDVLKKALAFYQQFASQNSGDATVRQEMNRAHRRAGDIQRFVGDHAAAQEAYRLAIVPAQELTTEFPGRPEYAYELAVVRNALGEELRVTGQFPAASEQFQQAIELLTRLTADYPTTPQYRAELARSHQGLGTLRKQKGERMAAGVNFQEALGLQSRLCAEFPSVPQYRVDLAEIHRNLGYWMDGGYQPSSTPEEFGHVRQACKVLQDLATDFPGVPLYRYRLASTLQQLATHRSGSVSFYHQAIAIMRKLIADFPQVPDYRDELLVCCGNLAANYAMNGDWDSAAEYVREALDLNTTLVTQCPSVDLYRAHLANSLVSWGEVLVYHGKVAEGRKTLEEAVALAQAQVKAYPNHQARALSLVNSNYLLSVTLVALRDGTEAAKRRKEADRAFDDTWRQLQKAAGTATAATFCADAALEMKFFGDGLKTKGRRPEMTAAYDAASKLLVKAVELDPKPARFQLEQANLYVQLGQQDKATASFKKAVELEPKNAGAWSQRAAYYQDMQQWAEAIGDCTKAIELDPTVAWVWSNRGFCYKNLKQWDKAIADCSKAIELEPDLVWPWGNRGFCYQELKQWDKALADCTKAIELEPKMGWTWRRRASCYENLKQWDKAIANYDKAIAVEPQIGWAWSARGYCYRILKQWDKALADFTKAIELDQKNANLHNDLAWRLATDPDPEARHPVRAVSWAKKAVELAPKQSIFWNTLGVAHYRAGDWKSALAALEKSVELGKGGNSFDWFVLAMCHEKLGDKEKARQWYDRAVEWMDKNQATNDELRRFRAEAAQVLGVGNK